MSSRTFFALGTASQVPTRKRNHNGYFLRWDQHGLLFDPGEGTQRQMTMAGISATDITKVFITHFHGDHCLGLAGIIQRFSLDNVAHAVEIYYPASGQQYYDRLRQASIFHNKCRIVPIPIKQAGPLYQDKEIEISTLPLDHNVDTWGFRLQEKDAVTMLPDKLDALGIRGRDIGLLMQQGAIETQNGRVTLDQVSKKKTGQSFAFVMDTRVCDNAVTLARDSDMLVCESTFLDSEAREAVEFGHLTAAQAADIANRARAKLLVLTHFSRRYARIKPFVEEARPVFENVVAVNDGDSVEIPKRQRLLAE